MRRQIPIWIFVSALMVSGCGKKTIRVDTPVALREAQVATPEELVRMVNERYAGFESVTVSQFKIDFVSGSVEKGYLEEYPSAKGHLVAAPARFAERSRARGLLGTSSRLACRPHRRRQR